MRDSTLGDSREIGEVLEDIHEKSRHARITHWGKGYWIGEAFAICEGERGVLAGPNRIVVQCFTVYIFDVYQRDGHAIGS